MYIHLGQDVIVRARDIVAILDIDTASVGKTTRDYLKAAQREGIVVSITDELPKSVVVCDGEDGRQVYISQISTATLAKRAELWSGAGGIRALMK